MEAAAGGETGRGRGGELRAQTRGIPKPGQRQILPGCSSGQLVGFELDSGLRRLRGAAAAAPRPPLLFPASVAAAKEAAAAPTPSEGSLHPPSSSHLARIARRPLEQIPISALAQPLPRPAASPRPPGMDGPRRSAPLASAARPALSVALPRRLPPAPAQCGPHSRDLQPPRRPLPAAPAPSRAVVSLAPSQPLPETSGTPEMGPGPRPWPRPDAGLRADWAARPATRTGKRPTKGGSLGEGDGRREEEGEGGSAEERGERGQEGDAREGAPGKLRGGREGDRRGGGAVRVGRGRGGPGRGEGFAEAECGEPAGLAPERA